MTARYVETADQVSAFDQFDGDSPYPYHVALGLDVMSTGDLTTSSLMVVSPIGEVAVNASFGCSQRGDALTWTQANHEVRIAPNGRSILTNYQTISTVDTAISDISFDGEQITACVVVVCRARCCSSFHVCTPPPSRVDAAPPAAGVFGPPLSHFDATPKPLGPPVIKSMERAARAARRPRYLDDHVAVWEPSSGELHNVYDIADYFNPVKVRSKPRGSSRATRRRGARRGKEDGCLPSRAMGRDVPRASGS